MTREDLKKAIDRLPPDQLQLVELYVQQLARTQGPNRPVRLGNLVKGIDLSEEDIAAARREMWGRSSTSRC